MSCSLILANFMPVLANVESEQAAEETPVIENGQDFIDLFCKVEIVDLEQENEEELSQEQEIEKELILTIDETNIDLILTGQSIYAGLDEEMQAQIEESFHQAYIDWLSEVNPDVDQEEIESQLPFASYADMLEQAHAYQQEQLEKEEQQEQEELDESFGIDADDNFDVGLDEGFNIEAENAPATLEDNYLIQEALQTPVFQVAPVEAPAAQAETPAAQVETPAGSVQSPAAQAETPAAQIETEKPQTNTAQNQIQVQNESEANSQPQISSQENQSSTQNETSSTLSSSAASFIATYVSDSQGIYTQVSNANYKQILSGLSAWNALSSETRAMVNNRLAAAGSSSYQSLLRQAQQIQTGSGTSTSSNTNSNTSSTNSTNTQTSLTQQQMPSVNTGVHSNAGRYTALFGASLAALYGILKTYMKQ
jgi:hypothetical protein